MSLRYLIEIVIFFSLMAFFQYEISRFNKDLHISIDEYTLFKALEHEIVERGGVTWKDSHGYGGNAATDHSGGHAADHGSEADSGHHRRILGGGGSGVIHDFSAMTMEEIQKEE